MDISNNIDRERSRRKLTQRPIVSVNYLAEIFNLPLYRSRLSRFLPRKHILESLRKEGFFTPSCWD